MNYYLIQHPVQLISGLNNSVPVVAVNHKNETLCVLEVVPPQGTNLQKKTWAFIYWPPRQITQHHEGFIKKFLRMHKDQTLNLVLATNIPDSETNVLVFHSLHIEP